MRQRWEGCSLAAVCSYLGLDSLLEVHEQVHTMRFVAEPEHMELYIGELMDLKVMAYDHEGFLKEVEPQWSRSSNLDSLVGEGEIIVLALSPGRGQVRASVGDRRVIIDVLVKDPPRLINILVDPFVVTLRVGESVNIQAIGKDQYGNDFSINPRWSLTGQGRLSSTAGPHSILTATDDGHVVIESCNDLLEVVNVEVFRDPAVLLYLEIVSD